MPRPAPLRVPPLGPAGCQVWWARLTDCRPAHQRLLDHVETDRRAAYRLPADQDRFTLGVVLIRTVLAAQLGMAPKRLQLDRFCPDCGRPHGRPRLDSGEAQQISFSISHSGDLVGAAFAGAPAVGLDVEQVIAPRAEGLAEVVLSPAEREAYDRTAPARRGSDFFRYWVRKEAVLKATGDGLRVPLRDLTVSPADQAPRLVEWVGRPDVPARLTLYDLDGDPDHTASLAVIGGHPAVREYDAGTLIGRSGPD
jgi:4'-phosphopantetheinyl transferase